APPLGAVHRAALGATAHLVWPAAFVRQQVTKPGFPQVDLRAQRTTSILHCFGISPLLAAAFAARAMHWTYCVWLAAVVQGHCSSAAARVDATAADSVQAARALPIASSSEAALIAKRFMATVLLWTIALPAHEGYAPRGGAAVPMRTPFPVAGVPVRGAVRPSIVSRAGGSTRRQDR